MAGQRWSKLTPPCGLPRLNRHLAGCLLCLKMSVSNMDTRFPCLSRNDNKLQTFPKCPQTTKSELEFPHREVTPVPAQEFRGPQAGRQEAWVLSWLSYWQAGQFGAGRSISAGLGFLTLYTRKDSELLLIVTGCGFMS